LFTHVIHGINAILKTFFASTTEKSKCSVVCSHCIGSSSSKKEPGRWKLPDIELAIADGYISLPCPNDECSVSLCDLAPDIFFANLPIITNLAIGDALGKGSLGSAYRGKIYNPMRDVVVKEVMINTETEAKAAESKFRPFYHELAVLSQLHHSNLVKLFGITLKPLRTVAEVRQFPTFTRLTDFFFFPFSTRQEALFTA